jgi:DnaJ family protein B protein 4
MGGGGGGDFMDTSDDDMMGGAMPGGFGVGGMPGGFASGAGGRARGAGRGAAAANAHGGSPNKKTVSRQLPVSLEDLYKGTTKKLKVTRRLYDASTGKTVTADKVLTVDVKPGWKAGTKIKFPGEGDEIPGTGQFQDLEFVIEEKQHPKYKRQGDDLRLELEVDLADALTGFSQRIETLDGRTLAIKGGQGSTVVRHDEEMRVKGEGMPISKMPGKKGDLVVVFKVRFPSHLNETQKGMVKRALTGAQL